MCTSQVRTLECVFRIFQSKEPLRKRERDHVLRTMGDHSSMADNVDFMRVFMCLDSNALTKVDDNTFDRLGCFRSL